MRYSYSLLCWIGLIGIMMGCTSTPEATDTPACPNLILIMADDLGYETLGVNGGTSYQTPRLDALAAGGMRFTKCFSQPLCTPSRVKIMTGKYNFRNYVGFGILDPNEKTFGHLLQDAGYTTCVVGKWQLYGNARQRELFNRTGALPDQAGFNESLLWQVKEKYGSRFKHPWVEENGGEAQELRDDYGPDAYLRYAEEFISQNKDTSFFLYFPMALVHDPFQPSPGSDSYETFSGEEKLNDTTYFRDNMAYMDKVVGQLVDHLETEGLRENTLVLFVGDNGTDRDVISSQGSRRIRGNKGFPTEDGNHVPMIASFPGTIAAGQVKEDLIDFSDFLPTLMEAAGAAIPQDFHTDGVSFFPGLKGEQSNLREWLFCHYAPQWGKFVPRRFVHNAKWKRYENGEIYHTEVDSEEKNPLKLEDLDAETQALMAEYAAVLAELK